MLLDVGGEVERVLAHKPLGELLIASGYVAAEGRRIVMLKKLPARW